MDREQEDAEFVGMNPVCAQMNKTQPEEQERLFLEFDSDFESGNLDMAIKTFPQQSYDLYLRPDTNTVGYFQWFYFRVKNKKKGSKTRFNIVNLTRRNSLYEQGMPVRVLSMKKCQEQGTTWQSGGDNIRYGLSKLMKNQMNVGDQDNVRRRIYFQLSWDYTFEYDHDEVFFAYSIPYTFSMVTNLVQSISEQQDRLIQEFKDAKRESKTQDPSITENQVKIVEVSVLAPSLAGVDVPMLTITDFSQSKQEEQRKKIVIITGRVHPGETNASWVVHGVIKFLLSKEKVAEELRKRVIFKIIPMINADGVTVGNTRCSLIGRDVNRLFGNPNQKLTPEPYFLRQLVKES